MSDVNVVPLAVVKQKIENKESVVGMTFVNERGARGTVLEALSDHKKRQAEMTCTTEGCTETHIREQSDWHQSYACRTHGKSKSRSSSSGGGSGVIKTDDGQEFRFMRIADADDAEIRAMKEANNTFYNALKARRDEEAKAAKAQREAERKAKVEEGRRERAAKAEAEKKRKLADQLAKMKEISAKLNIPISDVTKRQLAIE